MQGQIDQTRGDLKKKTPKTTQEIVNVYVQSAKHGKEAISVVDVLIEDDVDKTLGDTSGGLRQQLEKAHET